jgi:hypothetical protein
MKYKSDCINLVCCIERAKYYHIKFIEGDISFLTLSDCVSDIEIVSPSFKFIWSGRPLGGTF